MKYLFSFIAILIVLTCNAQLIKESWTTEKAPKSFKARFETTKGNFDIEAQRSWSPLGVDRLYQLIKHNYYTDIAIYRVINGVVAQFGINDNPKLSKAWQSHIIRDEPVIEKNKSYTIAFARAGKNSRSVELFINLKDNDKLDNLNMGGVIGFPVVAKVTSGSKILSQFYSGYGDKTMQDQKKIYKKGNSYLKKKYTNLDYIKKAYIIE